MFILRGFMDHGFMDHGLMDNGFMHHGFFGLFGRRFNRCLDRHFCLGRCCVCHGDRLGGGEADQRLGDGRASAAVHHIAERAQDGGEIFARTTAQRGHRGGHDKAVSIGGADRRFASRQAGTILDGRTDQIGQTLQNIHAHRAGAADTEACRTVKLFHHLLVDRNRGAARMGQMQDVIKPVNVPAGFFKCPQLGRQRTRSGFEQSWQGQMVGAEPHTHGAQGGAVGLLQHFHVIGHFGAIQHTESFGNLEGDATGNAGQAFGGFENLQRSEQFRNMGFQPVLQAQFDLFAAAACQMFVGQQTDVRFEDLVACRDAGDDFAEPADRTVMGQCKGLVDAVDDALGPVFEFLHQGLGSCGA